jgi:hypothetical protein
MNRSALNRRLAHLEALRPPPSLEKLLRDQRVNSMIARWCDLFEAALELMTEDEQDRAMKAFANHWCGPYAHWMRDLRDGWSRLPVLPAAAMKELLLAWLSPAVDSGVVCNRCGLERPYSMNGPPAGTGASVEAWRSYRREFERSCPGCGNAPNDLNWAHLTEGHSHDWKKLDGYVGARVLR